MDDLIYFNGLDGLTGRYLLEPQPPSAVAEVAGRPIEPAYARELLALQRLSAPQFAPSQEVDPTRLEEAGWGVIFPQDGIPPYREALRPLLDRRQAQAGRLFREYSGSYGYRRGESREQFLSRHGVGFGIGKTDPELVPHYLLLIGGPDEIPWEFQCRLGTQYAVGRLDLDPPGLERYALGVIEAEKSPARRSGAGLFCARHAEDPVTQTWGEVNLRPLAERLAGRAAGVPVQVLDGEKATRAELVRLLDPAGPGLVLAAGHGLGFPQEFVPIRRDLQGALVCADWPGPFRRRETVPADCCFTSYDVPRLGPLHGLIVVLPTSFAAGTPQGQGPTFAGQTGSATEVPFTSRLARRLLSHPPGAALAVVGLCDRAWGFSLPGRWAKQVGGALATFLLRLLRGSPVGFARQAAIGAFHAEMFSSLASAQEEARFGALVDPIELAGLWATGEDARNLTILGDPAVRLAGVP
jgi:hypothetical protein